MSALPPPSPFAASASYGPDDPPPAWAADFLASNTPTPTQAVIDAAESVYDNFNGPAIPTGLTPEQLAALAELMVAVKYNRDWGDG